MDSTFEEEVPLYEETQDAPWPLAVLGLGAGAAGGLALVRALSLIARFGAAALLMTGVTLALREYLVPFRITLTSDELILLYGRKTRFRIKTRSITRAYERQHEPIREFGGWGIRKSSKGRAFTMRGKGGVQLVLKSGARVYVGSGNAVAFAAALRALTGCDGETGSTPVRTEPAPADPQDAHFT